MWAVPSKGFLAKALHVCGGDPCRRLRNGSDFAFSSWTLFLEESGVREPQKGPIQWEMLGQGVGTKASIPQGSRGPEIRNGKGGRMPRPTCRMKERPPLPYLDHHLLGVDEEKVPPSNIIPPCDLWLLVWDWLGYISSGSLSGTWQWPWAWGGLSACALGPWPWNQDSEGEGGETDSLWRVEDGEGRPPRVSLYFATCTSYHSKQLLQTLGPNDSWGTRCSPGPSTPEWRGCRIIAKSNCWEGLTKFHPMLWVGKKLDIIRGSKIREGHGLGQPDSLDEGDPIS